MNCLDDTILNELLMINISQNYYGYAKGRDVHCGEEDSRLLGALIIEWLGRDDELLAFFGKNGDKKERRVFTNDIHWEYYGIGGLEEYLKDHKDVDGGFVCHNGNFSSFVKFYSTRAALEKSGVEHLEEIYARYLPEHMLPSRKKSLGAKTESALLAALTSNAKAHLLKKTSGMCGVGNLLRFGQNGLEVEIEIVPSKNDFECIVRTYEFDKTRGRISPKNTDILLPEDFEIKTPRSSFGT